MGSFLFVVSLGNTKGGDFWRNLGGLLVALGGTKAGVHALSLSSASAGNPAGLLASPGKSPHVKFPVVAHIY